jgi:hypothetical protein
MSQFEYNDRNKFFVSIGVFLIGLTFLLPWLFLRENFDLLIKSSDLQTYTVTAQDIIKQRQSITSAFSIIVPIVSICSFIIGIVLCYKGINGWKKLQDINEVRDQLINKKLTLEIERLSISETKEPKVSPLANIEDEKASTNKTSSVANQKTKEEYLNIPINNTWILNHWGSDVASIEKDKMIFRGTRTRLETDGCHINLKNMLKVGSFYKISCFVKALPNTTGKFQLWCHDNMGIEPNGSSAAIPYATPSIEGERCSLQFEAKFNTNLRIHLQYSPGEGQIEVSDIRITELQVE